MASTSSRSSSGASISRRVFDDVRPVSRTRRRTTQGTLHQVATTPQRLERNCTCSPSPTSRRPPRSWPPPPSGRRSSSRRAGGRAEGGGGATATARRRAVRLSAAARATARASATRGGEAGAAGRRVGRVAADAAGRRRPPRRRCGRGGDGEPAVHQGDPRAAAAAGGRHFREPVDWQKLKLWNYLEVDEADGLPTSSNWRRASTKRSRSCAPTSTDLGQRDRVQRRGLVDQEARRRDEADRERKFAEITARPPGSRKLTARPAPSGYRGVGNTWVPLTAYFITPQMRLQLLESRSSCATRSASRRVRALALPGGGRAVQRGPRDEDRHRRARAARLLRVDALPDARLPAGRRRREGGVPAPGRRRMARRDLLPVKAGRRCEEREEQGGERVRGARPSGRRRVVP